MIEIKCDFCETVLNSPKSYTDYIEVEQSKSKEKCHICKHCQEKIEKFIKLQIKAKQIEQMTDFKESAKLPI